MRLAQLTEVYGFVGQVEKGEHLIDEAIAA